MASLKIDQKQKRQEHHHFPGSEDSRSQGGLIGRVMVIVS